MSLAMKYAKGGMPVGEFARSRMGSRIGGITPILGNPTFYTRARAGNQGDFGSILSGIGKAVSFIPGVGTIAGAGLQALGGALTKKPKAPALAAPAPSGPGFGGMPILSLPPLTGGALPVAGGGMVPVSSGGALVPAGKPGACAPSGYHWNKSGYWSNESKLLPGASWTAPGTKLVKNRHRNAFNPKAASRAMSRLSALSAGMKTLERQMAKMAPRPRSSRCGCKSSGRFGKK